MTIRPVTPDDLPRIAAIQEACPEAAQWPVADYLNYACFVARNGPILGFIATRAVAPGEGEILNLAVTYDARRQGIGRSLLQHVLDSQTTWFLEVRESNSAAIRFYESIGFRPSGRRENYYTGPRESAIVMVLQK